MLNNQKSRCFAGICWALPDQIRAVGKRSSDMGPPKTLTRLSAIDVEISMYLNGSKGSVEIFDDGSVCFDVL